MKLDPRSQTMCRTGLLPAALLVLLTALPVSAQTAQPNADLERLAQSAAAARDNNNIPGAIALYRQALALDKSWADGWWFLGFLEYGADDYADAREALSHFIDLKPPAGPALALRGLCEFELADYDRSLIDIERGVALGAANQPRNEEILHFHEALLLTRAGQFERALQLYLSLAGEGMRTPAVTLGLGLAGLRIAALPNEVPADQQQLAIAAGDAALQFTASGRDNSDAGPDANPEQRPGAEHTPTHPADDPSQPAPDAGFRAFFARYPHVRNAHYFYGYLLFATEPQAAVAQFQDELQVGPDNAAALAMLAWAALMRADASAALPYATRAVAADADLPLAQLVLGRALLETGAVDQSIEHLEKARALDPVNVEAHIALARAYSTSNHPEEARRERLLSLQLTDDHAPAP